MYQHNEGCYKMSMNSILTSMTTPFTYFNYYNLYSNERKSIERNSEYIEIISNMLAEMFIIDGMSHEDTTHLMRTVLLYGSAYLKHDVDSNIICGGAYVGIPDIDSVYPSEYLATKTNFQFSGIPDNSNGETIVYCFPSCEPLTQIFRFASQFAEVDTSLVNNIQFARIAPVAVVLDDETKSAYEKSISQMLAGDLNISIKAPFLNVAGNQSKLEMLNISDGKYSEKIQYLSMFHEQLISRLCKLFGISYTYISKQANITNDELHNSDDFCAIYPIMMKNNINECLSKIGLSAKFNKPWEWIDRLEEMHDLSDNSIDNNKSTDTDETLEKGDD